MHADHGGTLDVGPPERNLVQRALAAADRHAGVTVRKRIPAGAGLGGGSADAAAVLRWAGWTGTADELVRAAASGPTSPSAWWGVGPGSPASARSSSPSRSSRCELTLVLPPFGCSTPAVYRAWDDLGGPTAAGPNDLEPAALAVEPRLAEWRDRLGDATGLVPTLAGSGSTWFVEGAFPGDGRVVVRTTPAPE